MEEMEIIMSKLEEMENRIAKLEKEDSPQKKETALYGKYTVDPKKMNYGEFAFVGRYQSEDGSFSSTFGDDFIMIKNVLKQSSFEMAKIIDAFASVERIDMIKLLMNKRLSAKELMEELKYPTTGKLYHHLSYLEKIGLVTKNEDKYYITPKCISAVVLILTGAQKIVRSDTY